MKSREECGLCRCLKIAGAGREAYAALARYHYRGGALGPVKAIYAMRDEHPLRRNACAVVGVIVYGCPAANLAIRNAATGGMFAGLERGAGLALLNARMLTIKRVIIEPRYRGLGLAARLVRQTLPLTGAAMVEAVAVMGEVHPFFTRAGMTEYVMPADAKTERMRAALETAGIGEGLWADTAAVHCAIEGLEESQRGFILSEMQKFLEKFATQRKMGHSAERTEFVLSKLGERGKYYLWVDKSNSKNQKAKLQSKMQKVMRSRPIM